MRTESEKKQVNFGGLYETKVLEHLFNAKILLENGFSSVNE
jgi:hypothetical protein